MALGATQSAELAYAAACATGETLDFFGVNMDYAPVCDVNSEPLNPVIGVRSFGDDPEFVGRFASATAKGLRDRGIVPCTKHFPGHGDTAVDSHYGLPVVAKTRDELERCELVPFRRAVAEGIEAVMTAHIALPRIGDSAMPATLSGDVLNILRKDMNYDGLVITDCLEMQGIQATYGADRGSVLALIAGCDSVMVCHTFDVQVACIKSVCNAIESGTLPPSRLDEAGNRVARLKAKKLSWGKALRPDYDTHNTLSMLNSWSESLAKTAYSQSVTVVRDVQKALPLPRHSSCVCLVPGIKPPVGGAVDGEGIQMQGFYQVVPFAGLLQRHNPNVTEIHYASGTLTTGHWDLIEGAETVILTTTNVRQPPSQLGFATELFRRAKTVVVVAACSPYDFLEDPNVKTYAAIYEPTKEAFNAAADVLFGASTAKGALPIAQRKRIPLPNISAFNVLSDLDDIAAVWNSALPTYALPADNLRRLLDRSNGHHFVARIATAIVGFCLAYTTVNRGAISGQIAVLAVHPEHQGKGIGTALLTETRGFFRTDLKLNRVSLTSCFPRFWPGIPLDLPSSVQDFFIHRGFRLNPLGARSVDLYQDIRDFQPPQKYLTRAEGRGFTFGPLLQEHHEECLVAQRRNFATFAVSLANC